MAVEASPSKDKVIAAPQSQTMESSPARRSSKASAVADAADSDSSFGSNDGSERQYSSPPNYRRNLDSQSPAAMKSEEYRQLFRLPLDEFLIQDFNCALQESFLIQGHMYVFHRHICFYSNIFGFETKKSISLEKITCIRRAKAAGIFPTAIEIETGDRKLFFTSFLSRDEAFNLLNDLWLQHGTAAVLAGDQPALSSALSNQSIQSSGVENVGNSDSSIDYDVRETDDSDPIVLEHPSNVEDVGAPKATSELQKNEVEEPEAVIPTTMLEPQNNIVEEAQSVVPATVLDSLRNVDQKAIPCQPATSSGRTLHWKWKEEDLDAPKTPECYTKVAETIFPIQVKDFFSFFLSDDAFSFVETFHSSCGDKDFKCTLWRPQDELGHTRQASFLHPIKFYLGAKFGCCQETQTFRVYKNSHLIMETSQEISDVPYGDHFIVKALWDVEKRDGNGFENSCVLRIYVYVAFSKKTMWKGKIVQSTIAECREAYSSWIMLAHEFLKQKNLENKDVASGTLPSLDDIESLPVKQENVEVVENSEAINNPEIQLPNGPVDTNVPRNTSASLKNQSYLGLLLLATVTVLLLMQLTIVILLARPSQVQTASNPLPTGYGFGDGSPEALAWLEKRFHHLKDEMLMVESRLERMRREYAILKSQLDAYQKLDGKKVK